MAVTTKLYMACSSLSRFLLVVMVPLGAMEKWPFSSPDVMLYTILPLSPETKKLDLLVGLCVMHNFLF